MTELQEEPIGFELFWEAYPRHHGKKAARKAWVKLNPAPDLIGRIMADVRVRAASKQWTKDGGQFCPHASSYLNGERWEDEMETATSGIFDGLAKFVARGHSDD